MTRSTSARIAGVAFVVYIAVGIAGSMVYGAATPGRTIVEKLAAVPGHLTSLRVSLLLTILSAICALVLAVTLHGITRDEDREIATFGLITRAGEGILGIFAATTLGMLWLGTATVPNPLDAREAAAAGALLVKYGAWKAQTCAFLFSLGSTAFCWLLLKGRMIPRSLAVLGVVASLDLVIMLPLQLAGLVGGMLASVLMWLPMLVFELVVAGYFIRWGVRTPR